MEVVGELGSQLNWMLIALVAMGAAAIYYIFWRQYTLTWPQQFAAIVIGGLLGLTVGLFVRYFGRDVPDEEIAASGVFGVALAAIYLTLYYNGALREQRSIWRIFWTLLVAALLGAAIRICFQRFDWQLPSMDWFSVILLGCGVGIGELLSRYRDAPTRALVTTSALVYICLNGAAGAAALAVARALGWYGEGSTATAAWVQVLTAGLGAMAVLRSSVVTVRAGQQDVAVGPSSFLSSIIDAADRAIDRLRAQERALVVARVMRDVNEAQAATLIPAFCEALMQSLPADAEREYHQRVQGVAGRRDLTDRAKLYTIGLITMTYMGEGVLSGAVTALESELIDSRLNSGLSSVSGSTEEQLNGPDMASAVMAAEEIVAGPESTGGQSQILPSA